MLQKIDHLGIAVHSIAEARTFYEKILGLPLAGREFFKSGAAAFHKIVGNDFICLPFFPIHRASYRHFPLRNRVLSHPVPCSCQGPP